MHSAAPQTAGTSANQSAIDTLDHLENLSPQAHQVLREMARVREYRDRETILGEGDLGCEFYVIADGEVTLFRATDDREREQVITDLSAGEIFGEMALVDGAPRSLSGRAKGGARLLVVDPEEVAARPDGEGILTELKACFAVAVVRRMRQVTDGYVEGLQRELENARTQRLFGQFFIYTLGLMSLGTVVNDVIARHAVQVDIYTQSFAWQYLLVLLLPSLLVIRRMGITMADLGLGRRGLRRSLVEGALISALAVALTAALAGTLHHLGKLPGEPMVIDPGGTFTYLIHSFLQELVARGFLQNAFQRFLNDQRGIRSVLLTSVLFGLFHLHFGLTAVVLTIVSGVAFGLLFLRNKNLAGVTLVHFTAGVCAFASGLF